MVAMPFGLIFPTKSATEYVQSLERSLWITIDEAITPNSDHIARVKQVYDIHLQF